MRGKEQFVVDISEEKLSSQVAPPLRRIEA